MDNYTVMLSTWLSHLSHQIQESREAWGINGSKIIATITGIEVRIKCLEIAQHEAETNNLIGKNISLLMGSELIPLLSELHLRNLENLSTDLRSEAIRLGILSE